MRGTWTEVWEGVRGPEAQWSQQEPFRSLHGGERRGGGRAREHTPTSRATAAGMSSPSNPGSQSTGSPRVTVHRDQPSLVHGTAGRWMTELGRNGPSLGPPALHLGLDENKDFI